jgi:hypothetical protein
MLALVVGSIFSDRITHEPMHLFSRTFAVFAYSGAWLTNTAYFCGLARNRLVRRLY